MESTARSVAISERPVRRTTMRRLAGDPCNSGVWIVVAAFNEGARLGACLEALCRVYAQIVVVDDGSQDDTYTLAGRYPVWRLRHAVNCGQGAALQTGIEFALRRGAEILVTFDADGQHSVEDIAQLVRPVAAGEVDVCLGSRFKGAALGIPWQRWLVLRLGVLLTRYLSRLDVTDTHNGLRAFSRRAGEQIRLRQNRMSHASEFLDEIRRHRLRYTEAPVTVQYTAGSLAKGQSTWNAVRILTRWCLGKLLT